MPTSLDEIKKVLDDIYSTLPKLIAQAKINPNQVLVIAGLSELSKSLGMIAAGEFRAGNSIEPGLGFTGVRMGYPSFSYSGHNWHLVGISDDVIQFGLNADDGTAWAGGGAVRLTASGLLVYNGTTNTGQINADGDLFFGSNVALPATTSLCIFATAQTYNGESVAAGDILIGSNGSGKYNLFWDASAGILYSRKGTSVITQLGDNSIVDSKYVTWSPVSAQEFAGGWEDVTSATVTLTTNVTCRIRVEALCTGYNALAGSGRGFYYRSVVAGTADPASSFPFIGSMNPPTNMTLPYTYEVSGVGAGSIVCKLQSQADSGINEHNFITRGRLRATAYAE